MQKKTISEGGYTRRDFKSSSCLSHRRLFAFKGVRHQPFGSLQDANVIGQRPTYGSSTDRIITGGRTR